ncbi:MAG: fumarylacetoacetate hydrolase family protein [SAR202 cluster bacterium]|nr:fumarylacetoacetate hydrolase [Chloroflexota bacterium]MQG85378.1 fumarylacetoacetate hydrolase family protein [SAR202 cluster bacterium]
MKLLLFDDYQLGVLNKDGNVVNVSQEIENFEKMPPNIRVVEVINNWSEYQPKFNDCIEKKPGTDLSGHKIRPPLPKPGKMVCMAVNYMENGTRSEPAPINAFLKSPNSVIGDGDTIEMSEQDAIVFEHEAELAMIIGKEAKNAKQDDWRDYIFGYMNFIDVSSRGLGAPPMDSFFAMKSPNTSAPMGPFIVTADEIPDPLNLDVKLWVNGKLRQDYHTSDMAHKIPRCIEWTSSITKLNPGDIVPTGTNHRGLGPIHDGDKIEMEIENMGKLTVFVKDSLKRQWADETRLERQEKGEQETMAPRIK